MIEATEAPLLDEIAALEAELGELDAAATEYERREARRIELRATIADIRRRQAEERKREAVRQLDVRRRESVTKAMAVRTRNERADRIVRGAFGDAVADDLQPDPEKALCQASALLAALNVLAESNPPLVSEACGPQTALRWRGDQMILGTKIRAIRGRNPMAPRCPASLPTEIVSLLRIARGEE